MTLLFKRMMHNDVTPPHVRADHFRALICTPQGVRRIAYVLTLFSFTCLSFMLLLPFIAIAFHLSLSKLIMTGSLMMLASAALTILARGLKDLKLWALYSFIAFSGTLYTLFLMRLTYVLSYGDFVAPIVNVVLLLSGCLYVLRPSVRVRFVR